MTRSELGSITKSKSGAWVCRVTVGYDSNGRRIQKSKSVRGTKKDARQALNKLLAQYNLVSPDAVNMTLSQFIDDVYLPWHDKKYPRRDSMAKLHEILGYVKDELGGIELTKLTRRKVEVYALDAPNWKTDKLRAVLRKAVEWDYIAKNPMDGISKHVEEPKRKRLTTEQLADVLFAFEGDKLEPVVLLMASCGLRKSEALAVNWEDIDYQSGRLRIEKGWHYIKGEGWFEPTKNANSNGIVYVPKSALKRLGEIRDGRTGALCAAPRTGGRLSPNTASVIWRKMVRPLLGDDYVPMENLRHTHGSILFDEGVSIDLIAKRLRNTPVIAQRHYISESESTKIELASRFDEAMNV